MFGTGEFASSASESTIPSCTSNSCTVGTYWRQIGSPGDWIRSTMAGEIRNSKFSAAWRSRAISPTCSGPNRAARASREAMLRLRSSSCQVSIEILGIDHQVVMRRVVGRKRRGPGVASRLVESARRRVIAARRRLDDDQARVVGRESLLHILEQPRSDTPALVRAIHDDPVEIVGPVGPRGRPPARVADQLVPVERAEEAIVLVAGQALVQQLDRGRDLLLAEETGVPSQPLKPCAVLAPDGAQRAAHARPWFLELH